MRPGSEEVETASQKILAEGEEKRASLGGIRVKEDFGEGKGSGITSVGFRPRQAWTRTPALSTELAGSVRTALS